MTGFVLSPAAQADVDQIWDYTAAQWSVAQAERYVGDIRDSCHDLAMGKRVSSPLDVREGYLKLLVGSRMLFFRKTDAGDIVIIRILHKSMDVTHHL